MSDFQAFILWWFSLHGRHTLPWRQQYDPYSVLVSELMLQQTQVERVIPKYNNFMERFPTVHVLAKAPLKDVLIAWQGLGYNRRAKFLHQTAQIVTKNGGIFPSTVEGLLELPGIGGYTASAVAAFSYNQPVTVIETNIRTVFIYHFFPHHTVVPDKELQPLITTYIDHNNPRQWYSALMDYGSTLKRLLPNPTRKSNTYKKQSKFAGSIRQTRGEILRILTTVDSISKHDLLKQLESDPANHQQALNVLINEGLVFQDQDKISLTQ